ncbi:MAG: hypothetical protein J5I65_15085 [Aridibacter famidurans]|nr:hypothetical protein [Aridibacter famidurans]
MTKSIYNSIAALLLIVSIAVACGGEAGEAPAENNASSPERASTEESSSTPDFDFGDEETEASPEPEEEETPEPAPAGPERVRFKRGMTEGRITLNLAPGEIKNYVVGVAPAQYFHVGMDDERLDVSLPSRARLTEINKGDSFVDGVTISTGDIVFEIRNPTNNAIRSFAIVTIQDREPMDH